ncbi:MAG: dUTP diphosphatase [Bauldia sp.]|nr:dUTP diphosphatase [Bauldia sp.]
MTLPPLKIRRLPEAADLPLPAYRTAASAGLDLCAAVPTGEPVTIDAQARRLIGTGLVLELPEGTEAQVRPRSGLALEHGLTVLNTPGTIDADYRGEVKVLLVNLGDQPVVVRRGMRIAQLVVAPVLRVAVAEVDATGETGRGAGGFGSTGTT